MNNGYGFFMFKKNTNAFPDLQVLRYSNTSYKDVILLMKSIFDYVVEEPIDITDYI